MIWVGGTWIWWQQPEERRFLVRTGLALFSEAASCVTDDCGFRNLTGERFSYKILSTTSTRDDERTRGCKVARLTTLFLGFACSIKARVDAVFFEILPVRTGKMVGLYKPHWVFLTRKVLRFFIGHWHLEGWWRQLSLVANGLGQFFN